MVSGSRVLSACAQCRVRTRMARARSLDTAEHEQGATGRGINVIVFSVRGDREAGQ